MATEAEFMNQLIQGLDADFWPSPVKVENTTSPTRSVPSITSTSSSVSTSAPSIVHGVDIEALLEGSEFWDLDDFTISPVKPKSPIVNTPQPVISLEPHYTRDPCTRCIVESVEEVEEGGQARKVVTAKVETGNERVEVYLCDDWCQTDIRIEDMFNIIGHFSPSSSPTQTPKRNISLTSKSNLLILHPDLLLTATALSNATQCRRKPLISSLVRSSSDVTPSLVWGNMLHEVMQKCLTQGKWDDHFVEKCIENVVQRGLGQLFRLGLREEVARREVKDRARGMKAFAEKYLAEVPRPIAELVDTRSGAHDRPSLLAIPKLLDIEEDIWSPTYGLKGKIDATVEGIISDPGPFDRSTLSYYTTPPLQTSRKIFTRALPLELKTGRALLGLEHRAQTMLYTLLLSERYASDIQDGLLFYTQNENGEVVRVPRGRNEIRALLGMRNEMAGFMWRRIRKGKLQAEKKPTNEDEMFVDGVDINVADIGDIEGTTPAGSPQASLLFRTNNPINVEDEEPFLPPPIDNERVCKRCYALDTCLLFRKAYPNHSFTTQKIITSSRKLSPQIDVIPPFLLPLFAHRTAHLTPAHLEFFRKWERLLAVEERDLVRFKRELWTMGAKDREEKGRCFAGMIINSKAGIKLMEPEEHDQEEESKIHRYTYAFVRSKTWMTSPSPPSQPSSFFPQPSSFSSSLHGHLTIGDAITVSVEPHLIALARGFILGLSLDEVVLGVDHELDLGRIKNIISRISASDQEDGEEIVFRIDKDELFGGMARIRSNLTHLFYADGDRRRLELVVDLRKPEFSDTDDPPFNPKSLASPIIIDLKFNALRKSHPHLNPSQLQAMHRVLTAKDYALILGMPGTGKTTVVAALITELVSRGKTVLLSSYTHSAVDTILEKVGSQNGCDKEDFKILRLGNLDKVHPDARKYTVHTKRTTSTVEQLEKQLMSPPVVATTCLSIDHPIFSSRKFDYCIVDEASQITLPTCLGPLRFADIFVLVGDHFQLPPLVKSPEARQGGLDVSLFRLLSNAHPHAVVDLQFQYRMNEDIMLLSNRLIYEDRLRCGSEEVRRRVLVLDKSHAHASGYCVGLGNQNDCWLTRLLDESCKAVFVDTDLLPAADSRVGDLVQNTMEAELVHQFTLALLKCGVREEQIGIISPYRQQVKLLRRLLTGKGSGEDVEILTADRSQGRDKDCVIVSLVRSNDAGLIGDLLKDWRRMNVSFTRARCKLVIFGSRKTLQRERLLGQFFDLMEGQGWILQLPRGADRLHEGPLDSVDTTKRKRCKFEAPAGKGKENVGEMVSKQVIKKIKMDVRPILRDVMGS